MSKLMAFAALGCLALVACENGASGNRYDTGTPRATVSPAGQTYSTNSGSSMPGARGGFNNDEITGKSRNPYNTTPGTGPMNSNPVASGNVPR